MSRTTTIPMEEVWHSDTSLQIPPPTYASSFQDIDLESGPRPSYDSDKEYLLRSSQLQYLTQDTFTISDYEDETFTQSSTYEEYDPFAFLADFDFISDGLWQSSPSPSRAPSTETLCHYPSSRTTSQARYLSSRPKSKIHSLHSLPKADTSTTPPPLILLFGWTNAQYQHLTIYASTYKRLFPSSRIIIITTTLQDLLIHSTPTKAARLIPVIDVVAHHLVTHPGAGILVHAFSDGGSHKAVEFVEAYAKRIGRALPIKAVCLDSTPGVPRYLAYCRAFRKCLIGTNPILQSLLSILGYILVGLLFTLYHLIIGYTSNPVYLTRHRLNNPSSFPITIPLLYLYSKTDYLIWWRDVKAHKEAAESMGRWVMEVVFEGSAHCAHILEDEGGYWGAVVEVWEKGMEEEGKDGEVGVAV